MPHLPLRPAIPMLAKDLDPARGDVIVSLNGHCHERVEAVTIGGEQPAGFVTIEVTDVASRTERRLILRERRELMVARRSR